MANENQPKFTLNAMIGKHHVKKNKIDRSIFLHSQSSLVSFQPAAACPSVYYYYLVSNWIDITRAPLLWCSRAHTMNWFVSTNSNKMSSILAATNVQMKMKMKITVSANAPDNWYQTKRKKNFGLAKRRFQVPVSTWIPCQVFFY